MELTPEQRALVDELTALTQNAHSAFAHLRVESGGKRRDVLLGGRTHIGGGVTVLDWQNAPLSQLFFTNNVGDEYEVESDDRALTGRLLERNVLRVVGRDLVEIRTGSGVTLARDDAGQWHAHPAAAPAIVFDAREATAHHSPVDVQLDPSQQAAVDVPPGRPVLLLGEAGCGKTTVALFRLARIRPQLRGAAAVIVPTEGLRRFTESMLERLHVENVEVWLYDRWAAMQARQAFRPLPQRESEDASAGVIRLKRHPSLRVAMAELATRQRPKKPRRELLLLFGDQLLLDRAAAASEGAVTPTHVAETLEHTRIQFTDPSEKQHRHVDADRLATIDGRSIDEGTAMNDAGTIDAEDYAVLFELDAMRRGVARPRTYDCIVLDEAQELAPLELRLVGRAVAPGGSLVVAGDAAQQVDPTTRFIDWKQTMHELGSADHDVTTLEVSYRSPPEVTALARSLIGRGDTTPGTDASRVIARRFDNELHRASALHDALRALRDRDRAATVAIICRAPDGARRLTRVLSLALDEVRLALHGDFDFAPGAINVTSVDEVKGLEFDLVVIPDASAVAYPDTPDARRALYVAVTRTVRQLVLTTVGTFSPLLHVLALGGVLRSGDVLR